MKRIGYNFGDDIHGGYTAYYYIQDGDVVKIYNPNNAIITIEIDKLKPVIDHVPDEVMMVK